MKTKTAPFKIAAALFENLERTASSNAMVRTLAEFLPTLSPEDVRWTAYLLSGKVGPSYSAPELGMAEKSVMRAIARAFALPQQRVERMFAASGDLGEVVARTARPRTTGITIGQVFETLRSIAETSGAGAQEDKVRKLADLLSHASPTEGKYIVRAVLGTYRVGVAEMTFLRGLARAFGRGKADEAVLEHAYNVLPDLGEVAFRAAKGGIAALARIRPVPGIPIRMMLATRIENLDDVRTHLTGDLFVEYKYDGERAQIHSAHGNVRIFSRRLEDITHQYPEIVAYLRDHARFTTGIIEGEIVAVHPRTGALLPFQVVMRRKRKHNIEQYRREVPIVLFLFDLLYANGRAMLDEPLSERKRLLTQYLKTGKPARIGAFVRTRDMRAVKDFFREAIRQGAEGVVIKSASSPYQAGRRGWHWVKFKKEYEKELADTFDVVIVGALFGRGSRKGSYGSLLVAAFDPETNTYCSFTKVGTGFTDALLAKLPRMLAAYAIPRKHRLVDANMDMDVWFEPAKVIEISGADLTVSPLHTVAKRTLKTGGIALRFPRFIRFRDDKTAEQATSVQEILDMYRDRLRRHK